MEPKTPTKDSEAGGLPGLNRSVSQQDEETGKQPGRSRLNRGDGYLVEEDAVNDSIIWWIILVISYILVAILTALSAVFIGYQVLTLFAPYLFSKIFGLQHQFPEYFYRVWGDDQKDLTSEHWGYLAACTMTSVLAAVHVLPHNPFVKQGHNILHFKTD